MNGNSHATICAIRGPVTLITIGALFALNNFTEYTFGRTWPVILIVFGLLSLLRRGTQPAGVPPAGGPGTPSAAPPYGYPAPGGYSRSPYAGGPATTPGAPAGTAKSGPATTAGTNDAPPGGSL